MSSTENKINSFAILGVGEIGLPIANELLAKKHDVRLFTRPGSKNPSISGLERKGARRVEVDYQSDASIEAALQGVDAIISTIGEGAVSGAQGRVARAASKVGGIKLFVPSLWGFDYMNPKVSDPAIFNPAIAAKMPFFGELERLGLPWIAVSNGLFSSWSFNPNFGIDPVARKAELKVDGEKKLTFTHLDDIAGFLHRVVTTQPLPAPGKGRWYYVEGYKASFNDVLAEAQRIDGKERPWTISQAPGAVEEARKRRLEPSGLGALNWVSSTISDGLALRQESDNASVGFEPAFGFQESVKQALEASRTALDTSQAKPSWTLQLAASS